MFCDVIWCFCGKEILEEREELSVDALFAQAVLSSDEENGRGDSTRFALPKTDTKIEQVKEKSIPKKTHIDTLAQGCSNPSRARALLLGLRVSKP